MLIYQPDAYDLGVLRSCARWAQVLGFSVMVAAGALLLAGLGILGGLIPGGPSEEQALYYGLAFITGASLCFLPGFYLMAFGRDALGACEQRDSCKLSPAFENLRACFRLAGFLASTLMALVFLGFFALLIALYLFTPDVSGFRS
jgi:hypothetical protein